MEKDLHQEFQGRLTKKERSCKF